MNYISTVYDFINHSISHLIRIKCMTGAMEGSLVTDKISVVLKYRESPVTSEEDFMFKVNSIWMFEQNNESDTCTIHTY